DSGNSRLKVGWFNPPSRDAAAPQNPSTTVPDSLAAIAREPAAIAFDNLDPHALGDWLGTLTHKPTLALGVNVAGKERGAGIRDALARHGCPVHWIRSRAQLLHLKNGYTQPTQLGADRLVSLLGVRSRLASTHPPFVLASFGTATTIDTVGPDDTFIAGLIFPGPAVMRSSLARGTAKPPLADGTVTEVPSATPPATPPRNAGAQGPGGVPEWLAA